MDGRPEELKHDLVGRIESRLSEKHAENARPSGAFQHQEWATGEHPRRTTVSYNGASKSFDHYRIMTVAFTRTRPRYLCLDTETTGLSARTDRICEIAAIEFDRS